MKKSFIIVLMLIVISISSIAQISKEIQKIALRTENENWIKFRATPAIENSSVFTKYKNYFGLSNDDQMMLLRTEKDKLGFTHERYQQHYKGVPVEGAQFIVHSKDGKAIIGNGNIITGLNNDVTPNLTPQEAINKAIAYTAADEYMWEDAANEQFIKMAKNNPNATYYPQAKLVLVHKDFKPIAKEYILAYKVNVYASKPLIHKNIYIDAKTGEVYHTLDLIKVTDVQATAHTKYSGVQTITVDNMGNGMYRLREAGRCGIVTLNLNQGTNYGNATDFTHPDTDWDITNANQDEVALDAHFGAEKTYDYYYEKFGRNSYDNNGSALYSYVHYQQNYDNAFWDGMRMTYGDGDGTSTGPFTSIDVCAHEITHGVTEYTADLIYQNEPGALNEAFSDIFAAAVEYYATPSLFDWYVGEDFDLTANGNGFRDMSNPNSDQQPDTYLGTYWYTGTMDNGGVHINSGVANYWFYLLTEGGSGVNDKGNPFSVSGIGIEKSEQIAYRALSVYLVNNSNFFDARTATIQSAIDLYGECSNEVLQTANAWYAVGVGMSIAEYDVYISNVVAPVTACGMTNETVTVRMIYNGCNFSIPAGDTIYFFYRADGGSVVSDTLILDNELNGGDNVIFSFDVQADVQQLGTHTIDCWLYYKNDSVNYNDTLIGYSFMNKLYQNSDVGVTGILEPKSRCFLSNEEYITVKVGFFGCEYLASGNKIPVAYSINNGTWVYDTVINTYDFYPDSVIYHTFSTPANFSNAGTYTIKAKTDFNIDSLNNNDLYTGYSIKHPFTLKDTVITFDEPNTYTNFLVTLAQYANAGVAAAAHNTGAKGFRMTGGNVMSYYNLLEFPDPWNIWNINEFLSAKITFCVDATNWSHANLRFDLKQTFGKSAYEMFLGPGNYNIASSFRILVNNTTQIGGTYNPVTDNSDPFKTHFINLDAYAGTKFTVTFETRNISKDTMIFIMDNAYVDNVGFSEVSYEGFSDLNLSNYVDIFPNPCTEKLTINFFSNYKQNLDILLLDMQGKWIETLNVNAYEGNNQYSLDLKHLSAGLYILKINAERGVYSKKIIKN